MPSTAIKTSQIKDDAVTFDKIENAFAEGILIGRGSGSGGGNYQAITLGSGLSMSNTILSAAAVISDGDKGDISVSGSGTTWTIDNNAITNSKISSSAAIGLSKLATQSTSQLVGTSTSSGTVTAITLGSGLTMTGTTLSASGGGGGGATTQKAFKSIAQTTNTTSGVYSNDSALSIVVGETGYYSIQIYVMHNSINSVFYGITGVAGFAKVSHETQAGYDLSNTKVGYSSGNSVDNFTIISGIINCTSGDNIRLAYYVQFGGNMTILAGSYMKIEKAN